MAFGIFDFFKDIAKGPHEIRARMAQRAKGEGIDYLDEEYKDQAKRLVSGLHPARMRLKVKEIIEETPTTKTFRTERIDGELPPFRAGRYVNLFVEINGVKTSRPYSISSAPHEDYLDLTVKEKPKGFVSPYLVNHLRLGDEFETTGPVGSFYIEPLIDTGELVFLAGGSGITPFMSMLKDQAKQGWPRKIHLLYGSRTLADTIFEQELNALEKASEKFNYALVLSEPEEHYEGVKGFLTAELIRAHIGGVSKKTFLVCGPNAMYDFVLPELKKLGVAGHKIRKELYGPPDDITRQKGWPKHIKADDSFTIEVQGRKTVAAKAGEPIMNSLERAGITPKAVCRSGKCSYCRMKLIEGEIFYPPTTALREADQAFGYFHSCTSYPLSNLVVRF